MNQLEKKDGKKAVIKTNRGDMTFVLLDEAAPKAVENFITHAKNPGRRSYRYRLRRRVHLGQTF